eukprot:g4932.t2
MLLRTSMMPGLPRAGRACLMSSGRTRAFEVGQGGRLVVDMHRAAAVVKVTTQWIDSCNVTISQLPAGADVSSVERLEVNGESITQDATNLTLLADEALTQVTLSHDQDRARDDRGGVYLVEAAVPELFSVDVVLARGNVSVAKKLKGDCQVQLNRGDINVGTVRGETIRLSTGCGHVKADELEGNVDVTATADVYARLINGARVRIDATGDSNPSVTVGALYSSGAHIRSAGNVAVSSCHGRIAVDTAGFSGGVNLSSVNGTAQVSAGQGGATVHMDVLEEGTACSIRSDGGDVNVSMSQQVDVDLDIEANSVELPPSFEGDVLSGKAVGSIKSAAVEPSRATRYGSNSSISQDAGGGKIDLVGARGQSLRQYFPNDAATSSLRPKLSMMAKGGSVAVEILSWADNIARKFTAREAAKAGP